MEPLAPFSISQPQPLLYGNISDYFKVVQVDKSRILYKCDSQSAAGNIFKKEEEKKKGRGETNKIFKDFWTSFQNAISAETQERKC